MMQITGYCLFFITGPITVSQATLIYLAKIKSFWIFNNALTQMVDSPTRGSHVLDIFEFLTS